MSEFIINRKEKPEKIKKERQERLKLLIKKLHDGVDINIVKNEFEKIHSKYKAHQRNCWRKTFIIIENFQV